jgi:hypothetical protein
MLTQQFPIHYFHAYGCAFGATINKPFPAVIESQAATSISAVGGHAFSSAGPYNCKEIVRFSRASTQIAAVEQVDSYDTVITCILEDVNVFNQFTADEIVAHLAVRTSKDGKIENFNTVGTRFVNLRVGGAAVNPVLVNECESEYRGRAINPVYDMFTGEPIEQKIDDPRGYLTTLVQDAKVDSTSIKSKGNAIVVPDFGVAYLAEYLVTPYARQLNMFRIQLGCAGSGCASGGGVGGNGSTVPPGL